MSFQITLPPAVDGTLATFGTCPYSKRGQYSWQQKQRFVRANIGFCKWPGNFNVRRSSVNWDMRVQPEGRKDGSWNL